MENRAATTPFFRIWPLLPAAGASAVAVAFPFFVLGRHNFALPERTAGLKKKKRNRFETPSA